MCTHPFAKKAFTLHLSRSEGHERYFGCNLMHRKALASSYQHLMAEAPGYFAYKKNYKAYVEVISFDRLVNLAKERNRAFFDKLGLPTR